MRLRSHDQSSFAEYLNALDQQRIPLSPDRIIGSDIDGAILEVCRRNLDRAQFSHLIRLKRCALHNFELPDALAEGLRVLVSNPPYGERMGHGDELLRTYQQLGALMKQHLKGGEAALIVADDAPKALGLRPENKRSMRNGSIDCHLLRFIIHANRGGPSQAKR